MSTAARKRRVDAVGAPPAAVGSTRRRTSAGGSSSVAGAASAGRGAAAAASKSARGRGVPIANRLPAPPVPVTAASFGIAAGDAHAGTEGLDDAYDGMVDGAEVGSVGLPLSYDDGSWAAETHAAAPVGVLDGEVRIPAFLNKLYRCGTGVHTRGASIGSRQLTGLQSNALMHSTQHGPRERIQAVLDVGPRRHDLHRYVSPSRA